MCVQGSSDLWSEDGVEILSTDCTAHPELTMWWRHHLCDDGSDMATVVVAVARKGGMVGNPMYNLFQLL